MRLVAVGTSGSFAGPDSPASAYLVQVGAEESGDGRARNLALDLGNGALGALQRFVDPLDLDGVGLSHLHPDHCADMSGLYVYLRYHPERGSQRTGVPRALPVWGPVGTLERLGQGYGLAPGESMAADLDVRQWEPGTRTSLGPLEIEPVAVRHPVPAFGIRVTGPSSERPGERVTLAYTGDTDTCPGVVELARDVDLLLAEAAFHEGRDDDVERGIHLTGRRAGEIAAEAGARRLVLTHIPAWNDPARALAEAREVYDGPIEVATAGAVYTL